jgi:hypothetical protein
MENPAPAPIGVNKAEGGERLRLATLNSRAVAGAARPPLRSRRQTAPTTKTDPCAGRFHLRYVCPFHVPKRPCRNLRFTLNFRRGRGRLRLKQGDREHQRR